MLFTRNTSFAASTETLTSVTSTTSTSSLMKKPSSQTSEKDYFAALGALQNQYGFGGSAPAPVTLPKASGKSKKSKSTKHGAPAPTATSVPKGEKDYEAAYGALCSSYGFGSAPISSRKASWLGKK